MSEILHYRLKLEFIRPFISQEDFKRWWLAESVGIHKSTLRRWLSGEIQIVRGDHVSKLANAISVPLERIADPVWLTRTSRIIPARTVERPLRKTAKMRGRAAV